MRLIELLHQAGFTGHYGISVGDTELINIKCTYAFEPHGRASETWEECWDLTLVHAPKMWKNNQSVWVQCTPLDGKPLGMTFRAKTLYDAVFRAECFLADIIAGRQV